MFDHFILCLRSSHGHRYHTAQSLGERQLTADETESLIKDYAFEMYFFMATRRGGYDFLYHSLLAGGIPSLDTVLRWHSAHSVLEPLSALGFHFSRFSAILSWLSAMAIPTVTLFHLCQDETSCLPWVDFSALTGELVGVVVPDELISSTDLRPRSCEDVKRYICSAFAPATKLCVVLLCPLVVHRPPLLVGVFGATSKTASSEFMLARLSAVKRFVHLFTQGLVHVVTYAHDASSGEHGVSKQHAARTVASSLSLLETSADARAQQIVIHIPRPAISHGKGDVDFRTLHGRVTPARFTVTDAVDLRKQQPLLPIAWPLLSAADAPLLPFIDSVHIAKCLFSALRSHTLTLQIGHGVASTSHVLALFDNYTPRSVAEQHFGVQRGDLLPSQAAAASFDAAAASAQKPADPMRFPPVERFCGYSMQRLLEEQARTSHEFKATYLFQTVIRFGALSMLDPGLCVPQIVYRLAWAYYFLSGWRQWLQVNHYDLRKYFVFHAHLTSIQTNLHSLMFLCTYVATRGGLLPTWLISSQWNEDFFRRLRDVHGSSLFSPLQCLRRAALIELHSQVRARRRDDFVYPPRHASAELDELHHDSSCTGDACFPESCNPQSLSGECSRARADAEADLFSVGVFLLENQRPPVKPAVLEPAERVLSAEERARLDKEDLDSDDDVADDDLLCVYARGTKRGALAEVNRDDVLKAAGIDEQEEAEALVKPAELPSADAHLWAHMISRPVAGKQLAFLFSLLTGA